MSESGSDPSEDVRLDELVERFVDDRDSLSEAEWQSLAAALAEAPERAVELKQQLLLQEAVAQQVAVDRRRFSAQIAQRLSDHERSEDELAKQLVDVRRLMATDYESSGRRALFWQRIRLFSGIALALLAAAGVGTYLALLPYQDVAALEGTQGEVVLLRGADSRPAAEGDGLRRGDKLQTGEGASAVLRYPDGTVVELGPRTTVALASDPAGGGKRVELGSGELAAVVARQPQGRPMVFGAGQADAVVVGTRLYLIARPEDVRLDVTEGSVELIHRGLQTKKLVAAQHHAVLSPAGIEVRRTRWPTDSRGLAFKFETGGQANLIENPACGEERNCVAIERAGARLDHDYAMEMAGGSFITSDVCAAAMLDCCRATGEFTIEAVVMSHDLDQDGPARIVTSSAAADQRNFMLGQQGDRLVLSIVTSATGPEGAAAYLCRLPDRQKHHLLASYRDGRLIAWLDGKPIFESDEIHGDLSVWRRHPLVFGDEFSGGRSWSGTLEGVAVYNRFLTPHEAERNAARYRRIIESRPAVPQLEIAAELYQRSFAPTPEELLPQRKLLVTSKYQVKKVLRGTYEDEYILVVQWSVLDAAGQPINVATPGDEFHLLLENVESNPQLEHVTCADDFDDALDGSRSRFYEVRIPQR